MRLHVTVTDTGETAVFDAEDCEARNRFIGNSLATMAVSTTTPDGDHSGPAVIIRWIPDEEA